MALGLSVARWRIKWPRHGGKPSAGRPLEGSAPDQWFLLSALRSPLTWSHVSPCSIDRQVFVLIEPVPEQLARILRRTPLAGPPYGSPVFPRVVYRWFHYLLLAASSAVGTPEKFGAGCTDLSGETPFLKPLLIRLVLGHHPGGNVVQWRPEERSRVGRLPGSWPAQVRHAFCTPRGDTPSARKSTRHPVIVHSASPLQRLLFMPGLLPTVGSSRPLQIELN
jgi:hypothetical protein